MSKPKGYVTMSGHSSDDKPTGMRGEVLQAKSKRCPLLAGNPDLIEAELSDCIEEECAWWAGTYCDISGIRVALDEIATRLGELTKVLAPKLGYTAGAIHGEGD